MLFSTQKMSVSALVAFGGKMLNDLAKYKQWTSEFSISSSQQNCHNSLAMKNISDVKHY